MFVNVKKGSIVSYTPGMEHGGMARYVQLGCAADGVEFYLKLFIYN